jgi:regulator of protease activity HflC (stomatin/prohibitin superfamily)
MTLLGSILELVTLGGAFIVPQNEVGIVERFGKFQRIARAGLNFKIPLVDSCRYQSLRIQQLDVEVATKTKDNVFVELQVSVQYRVKDDDQQIYRSFYELEDPEGQITAYIFDIVRAEVPKLTIDEIFNEKGKIASAIKTGVGKAIEEFGYQIIQALITDIKVDERIIQAMNDIVASEREKQAAIEKAEAKKILKVKEAEAEAESKRLQGIGIANERKAIIDGLVDSIEDVRKLEDISTQEVMKLILITQYFDTLKDVSQAPSNTIMLPGTPDGFQQISKEIGAILSATSQFKKESSSPEKES